MASIKQFFIQLKTKSRFSLLKEKLKDKKAYIPIGIIIILLLIVGGYKTFDFIKHRMEIPQVLGANFSLEYRKIPFDVKTIEINLSTDLKKESINQKGISLSPFVEGKTILKGKNTLVYELGKNLEIGQEYALTISKDIESAYGVKLGKDYSIIFEAISGAKVTKILPEGQLNDISKNALVFFNIPMVPLTNLKNRDSLPCPVEVTPKIEGTCRWQGGNIIEFIPKTHWEGATEYKLSVNATASGLIYPLKEVKSVIFKTPELTFSADDSFSPKDGIPFRSNFPIDAGNVEKSLSLAQDGNKIPVRLQSVDGSETKFIIYPKNGNFSYAKSFLLNIPVGISPKNGNMPNKIGTGISLSSRSFLMDVVIHKNVYSSTGALIDTPVYDDPNKIPDKDVFFEMDFDQDVTLDKSQFSFTDSKGKQYDYDLKYGVVSEYDDHGKETRKESKQKVNMFIKEALAHGTKYSLTVLKKANPYLAADDVRDFTTAPEFKILGFEYKSNTLACLYFTNDLFQQHGKELYDTYGQYYNGELEDPNQKLISLTPKAIIRGLYKDNTRNATNNYICPQKAGSMSYVLNLRLEPFKDYILNLPSGIQDSYGNTLSKNYTYNIKSGDVTQNDKYVYSSFQKPINLIPVGVPAITDIQTINLDKLDVNICELDPAGYLEYSQRNYEQGYSAPCIRKTTKTIQLKNKNWTLSHNKLDIEKDIMGGEIKSPIYVISAKIGYGEGNAFSYIIIRSGISLAFEKASNKSIIFASSFDGKETPSDLSFHGYYYDSNLKKVKDAGIIKTKWNNDKKAYELEGVSNYDLIQGQNQRYSAVINTLVDMTSNYDFKYISGQDSSTKDYLYLYTERPIYKPGDTVFFKGLLRTFRYDGFHRSDIKVGKMKINDENGNFLKDVDVTVDKNSNFSGKFELPKEMNLGKFVFQFYPDGKQEDIYNDANFFVEEYKKPVFKVNMDGGKKDFELGDKIDINFNAEYYFGGRLTKGHYFKGALVQNYFFDAKNFSDYQFGNNSDAFDCLYWGFCNYDDFTTGAGEGELKPTGEDSWSFDFPKDELNDNKKPNGEKIYSFNITMEDPDTKKTVNQTYETVLHTTDAYVGLKVPYYNKKDDGVKVDGVILNFDAQGLARKSATIEMIHREWKQVKKQGVDGVFYNDYSIEEKSEGTTNVTSDSNGEFSQNIKTQKDGEYEVRAKYTGNNGKTYTTSAFIYVAGPEAIYWNEGNNTVTDLTADKSMLKIGDTAGFTLKSPVTTGKMLVTVEKDDGLMDYFTQDIKSTGERISVPIKDNYYPNFYVKVFLIGKQGTNPLPVYKRALSVIKIVTDYKNLKVNIQPEKNRYLPGDKVKLKIKATDQNGNPVANANGSVGLVDESLLALKGNPKKNPFAFFYEMKRYLGIETYISLFNLVEKLDVKDISDGEKGGAGEGQKGGNAKKKRGVFKDTAFWQADFTTGKDGIAIVTTDALPDNLTTWDIESIVSTTDDARIGIGESTIVTTKKVVINENLPRFLGSKDKISFSPVIFNKTGKDSSFKVTFSGDNVKFSDGEQNIRIKNGDQATLKMEADVADIGIAQGNADLARINIKAVSTDTNDEDEVEVYLPINETSTLETVATVGKTDSASYTEKIDLSDVILSSAKLVIRYAPTILSNITSGMDFLARFPYGCIEQKQSAVMPNVYLKKLFTSIGLPFDLTKKMVKVFVDTDTGNKEISEDEIIKNYIAESIKYQKNSGGFAYWSDMPNDYADFHLTSEIVSGMSDIRSIGYTINDNSIKSAVIYLKTRFYANKRENCFGTDEQCRYSVTERLEAIKAIQDYDGNDYEPFKMLKLVKADELSSKILVMKITAKLLSNKNISATDRDSLSKQAIDAGNQILTDYVVYNPRGAFLGKDADYTRIKNTAEFVGAVSVTGLDKFKDVSQIIDNMNAWIISQKKEGAFGSTEDTNSVLNNLSQYIIASGELKNINSNIKLNLNGETVSETSVNDKNKLDVFEKIITGDKLKKQNDVIINKQGNGRVYYDLALNYYMPSDKIDARDEGFFVEQDYFDYNEYRRIETLKNEEYTKYLSGDIDYKDLKYPKSVVEYIKPLDSYSVGQLIVAYNKIAIPETRDQVAFEGFIPSGTEIVNTNLSTENQNIKFTTFFDREEIRDDRYFGFAYKMDPGLYEFNYVIRVTHDGTFNLKPSRAFEFYHPEVFGRTAGKILTIEK